jgi:signal transduction histidine kinase
MSSLGHLVAGVAHEINNPISFIYSNIYHAKEYSQNLIHLIKEYHKNYPEPPPKIQAKIEEFDLAFLLDDLPKLLHSMEIGSERIREIVKSLRNFSRLDEAELKTVDLHEGIDSTLLILQHQLKAKGNCAEIKLIKEYGNLPKVMCYPGQLNQVFMNLIANAIDALDEKRVKSGDDSGNMPWIRIQTEVNKGSIDGQQDTSVKKIAIKTQSQLLVSEYEYDTPPLMSTPIYSSAPNYTSVAPESILIRITDNGMGMTQEVLSCLFEPFFTTKPAGKGTGLGLSISYRIIVEKHKGNLLVNSSLDQGTEFIIELPLSQHISKSVL